MLMITHEKLLLQFKEFLLAYQRKITKNCFVSSYLLSVHELKYIWKTLLFVFGVISNINAYCAGLKCDFTLSNEKKEG